VGQRPDAILVGTIHVRAVLDQEIDDLLMRFIASAEDDCLEQGRPTEVVHVVDVDIAFVEQVPDDLDVAALTGRDQAVPPKRFVRLGSAPASFRSRGMSSMPSAPA
jgi:hypothetical protein